MNLIATLEKMNLHSRKQRTYGLHLSRAASALRKTCVCRACVCSARSCEARAGHAHSEQRPRVPAGAHQHSAHLQLRMSHPEDTSSPVLLLGAKVDSRKPAAWHASTVRRAYVPCTERSCTERTHVAYRRAAGQPLACRKAGTASGASQTAGPHTCRLHLLPVHAENTHAGQTNVAASPQHQWS